jgi:hypothetical protein
MKVISQTELNKEQLYLEKQKQIISEEREKLMIERSRLYYEWRDLQELDEEYKKIRENLNESNAILTNEMNKRHELNKKAKEDFWATEIGEQRKKQEKEFDIQLANDRKKFEILTKKLEKEIENKHKKIIKQKENELESQLTEDRKRFETVTKKLEKEITDKHKKIIKQQELELEEQLTKDRKRLDILRNEIYNDINNANSIIKDTLKINLELEMISIRKQKENELESQLTEDRNRLDKIRAEIAEEIAIETAKLNIYKKAKQLI